MGYWVRRSVENMLAENLQDELMIVYVDARTFWEDG